MVISTAVATLTDPEFPGHFSTLLYDYPDCYRWYDDAGMDTEVSAPSIATAIDAARAAWPGAIIQRTCAPDYGEASHV